MKSFHDLTQIGRGLRLRPVALQVLREYGIEPTKVQQILEASNIIFRVRTDSAGSYVLRMTSPKSCHGADEIRSEIAWLNAIAEETDIGVPAPVARPDGNYISQVMVPGASKPIGCALYRWVPGVMLDNRLTEANVRRLGILMARLHEHAAVFEPPEGFHIHTYDSVFPYAAEGFAGIEPVLLFNEGEDAPLTTRAQRAVYKQVHDLVAAEVEVLMADCAPLRVIHSDLHMWNVKVDRGKLYALDFEDLLWGRPIQDIATTLYYFRWSDTYETMRTAFRLGYESVSAWPEDHDGQLETLIMGRAILLANYITVSEDSEDRAFAPEYLARVADRLRGFLAEWT